MLWLLSPIGRTVMSVGALVLLWFAFASHYQHKGARNVVNDLNSAAEQKSADARAARNSIPDGGNADWLRKYSCRDC